VPGSAVRIEDARRASGRFDVAGLGPDSVTGGIVIRVTTASLTTVPARTPRVAPRAGAAPAPNPNPLSTFLPVR
jgi:hypothetical protein